MRAAENATLDANARALRKDVQTAVETFLGSTTAPLPGPLARKLNFADTDLVRLAHVNQRFLELLISIRWPQERPSPKWIGVSAYALAIRGWLRQVHIHSSFYRYIENITRSNPA